VVAVPKAYGLLDRLTTILGEICRVGPGVVTARIRFLSGLYRATKRTARILSDQDSESGRFDSRYFLFGFTSQVILGWAHDRDYSETRTNNWRRFSVSAILFALALKLIDSIAEDERESLLLGSAIGTVLYRFWYGVFNPLPA